MTHPATTLSLSSDAGNTACADLILVPALNPDIDRVGFRDFPNAVVLGVRCFYISIIAFTVVYFIYLNRSVR